MDMCSCLLATNKGPLPPWFAHLVSQKFLRNSCALQGPEYPAACLRSCASNPHVASWQGVGHQIQNSQAPSGHMK